MKILTRIVAVVVPLLIAVIGVAARWWLFATGALYGDTAAKMASLAVAGVIIVAGAFSLALLRKGTGATGASRESIVAVLTGALGLATAAYGFGELFAPNTPVAATASACKGAPVYGARFFARTIEVGANSRQGAGRQFAQVNRYGGNCTLGFDGYCIGPSEKDTILGTPDQRWLIVHNRDEVIASAVVLSQTREAALGSEPSPKCAKLGGQGQPTTIQRFSYDTRSGELSASAKGAVGVGYGVTAKSGSGESYKPLALGVEPGFAHATKPADIAKTLGTTDGDVLLGAAICLADNVPVLDSLTAKRLTLRNSKVVSLVDNAAVPSDLRNRLAEIACNSSG